MKLNTKLRKTSVPETVLETARESDEDDKDSDDDQWFDDSTTQLKKARLNNDREKNVSRKRKLRSLKIAGRKCLRTYLNKIYFKNRRTKNFLIKAHNNVRKAKRY
jgi:hypothetical protein